MLNLNIIKTTIKLEKKKIFLATSHCPPSQSFRKCKIIYNIINLLGKNSGCTSFKYSSIRTDFRLKGS